MLGLTRPDGALWACEEHAHVGIALPVGYVGEIASNGVVCVFNDPFTTYEIAHETGVARVTVYASNFDGALCAGAVDLVLRDHLAATYGIHRWSEHTWQEKEA